MEDALCSHRGSDFFGQTFWCWLLQPEIYLADDPVEFLYGALRDVPLLHSIDTPQIDKRPGWAVRGRFAILSA